MLNPKTFLLVAFLGTFGVLHAQTSADPNDSGDAGLDPGTGNSTTGSTTSTTNPGTSTSTAANPATVGTAPVPLNLVTTPTMVPVEPVVTATNGSGTTSTNGVPPADTPNTVGGINQGAINNLTTAIQSAINSSTNSTNPAPQQSDYTSGNYFKYYHDLYLYFNSTPMLYVVGVPMGTFLSQYRVMGFFAGFTLLAFMIRMGSLLQEEQRDIRGIAALVLKLFVAAVIYSNPAMIYAASMEVMVGLSGFVNQLQTNMTTANSNNGVATRLGQVTGAASALTGELAPIRDKAVRAGLADRAGVFTRYANDPVLDAAATDYWAFFLTAMGNAMNTDTTTAQGTQNYPPLPRLTTATSNPDGSTIATHGALDDVRAAAVRRYVALAADSANIPSGVLTYNAMSLNWAYTDANGNSYSSNRGSYTVKPLSNFLDTITANISTQLQNVGSTGNGMAQKQALLDQYAATVRAATSNWIDSQLLDQFAGALSDSSMSAFWNEVADMASYTKRALLGTAAEFKPGNLMDKATAVLSSGITLVKNYLMPVMTYVMQGLFRLMAELAILGMMVTIPFWLLSGPLKKAFTGSLETVMAVSLILPMWTFFQMLLDALYGGFCTLFTAFTLAEASAAALVSGGAAVPAILALNMLILAAGYLLASLVLAWKSPAMARGLLSGGSWIAGLLGSALVGGTAALLVAGGVAVAGAGSLASGFGGVGKLAATAGARLAHPAAKGANAVGNAGRRIFGRATVPPPPPPPKASWAATKVSRARAFRVAGKLGAELLQHGGDPVRAMGGYLNSRAKNRDAEEG